MSRVDFLPESGLEETIRDLERDLREIKGIQFMGADVLVPKVNVTSNTYDEASVNSFGDQRLHTLVTFVADHQPDVFAALAIKLYDMSGNELSQSFFDYMFITPQTLQPSDHTVSFDVDVQKFGGPAFQAKFYLLATDTGTITN